MICIVISLRFCQFTIPYSDDIFHTHKKNNNYIIIIIISPSKYLVQKIYHFRFRSYGVVKCVCMDESLIQFLPVIT